MSNRLKKENRIIDGEYIPKRMSMEQIEKELEWAENNYFSSSIERIQRRYRQSLRLLKNENININTKFAILNYSILNKIRVGFKKNLVHGYSKEGMERIKA